MIEELLVFLLISEGLVCISLEALIELLMVLYPFFYYMIPFLFLRLIVVSFFVRCFHWKFR